MGWARRSSVVVGVKATFDKGGTIALIGTTIDYGGIPSVTRAQRVGRIHGLGNVAVVALVAVSWWLRRPAPEPPSGAALACSLLGIALATMTAWLGGELVERLGVAVHDGANVDAPGSLSRRPVGSSSGASGR